MGIAGELNLRNVVSTPNYQTMKKLVFLFLVLFTLAACSKRIVAQDKTTSQGLITTLDPRTCACHCGDFYINIDGKDYLFQLAYLPETEINFSEIELPLAVTLEWENEDPNPVCPIDNRITIFSIAEQ